MKAPHPGIEPDYEVLETSMVTQTLRGKTPSKKNLIFSRTGDRSNAGAVAPQEVDGFRGNGWDRTNDQGANSPTLFR